MTTLTTQTIPRRNGDDVVIAAEKTECPYLVITQSFGSDDGKDLYLLGGLNLTHTLTGAQLPTGGTRNLRGLAAALKDFDWNFTAETHFVDAGNEAKATELVSRIREFVTAEGNEDSGWLQDTTLLDLSSPATSFLSGLLDQWQKSYAYENQPKLPEKHDDSPESKAMMQAWFLWVANTVSAYGTAYLMAVLRATAPDIADIAAKQLAAEWEAGEGMGEWIWQWNKELREGKPLTLHGIPSGLDADALARTEQ